MKLLSSLPAYCVYDYLCSLLSNVSGRKLSSVTFCSFGSSLNLSDLHGNKNDIFHICPKERHCFLLVILSW